MLSSPPQQAVPLQTVRPRAQGAAGPAAGHAGAGAAGGAA
jgi:hypothetical protein